MLVFMLGGAGVGYGVVVGADGEELLPDMKPW